MERFSWKWMGDRFQQTIKPPITHIGLFVVASQLSVKKTLKNWNVVFTTRSTIMCFFCRLYVFFIFIYLFQWYTVSAFSSFILHLNLQPSWASETHHISFNDALLRPNALSSSITLTLTNFGHAPNEVCLPPSMAGYKEMRKLKN